MDYPLRPLTLDLSTLDGLSQRLIASHHENNYAGAVKRLNAIRQQLSGLDWASAPVFVVNGLKREELIAANSAHLHELYFDALGGNGVLPSSGLSTALDRLNRGEYGICMECGERISPARLHAIPETQTCVRCQDALERRQRERSGRRP